MMGPHRTKRTKGPAMTTTAPARTPGIAAPLPAPSANRLRRPSWRDPRLVVGLLLVAASVAAGSWVVSAAQASTPVWVARETLTPGTEITARVLEVAEVRLTSGQLAAYLDATEPVPSGHVVLRTVQPGELVPRSALGDGDTLALHPVPLTVPDPGASVTEGAVVDLWFVPEPGEGAAEPSTLANGLTVAEVVRPTGAFTQGQTVVHVLVPQDELPDVLAATAAAGSVRVVPVLGGS